MVLSTFFKYEFGFCISRLLLGKGSRCLAGSLGVSRQKKEKKVEVALANAGFWDFLHVFFISLCY
jgi:hypothetical protein